MKKKFWSFQMAFLLLGLNLAPVVSLADELSTADTNEKTEVSNEGASSGDTSLTDSATNGTETTGTDGSDTTTTDSIADNGTNTQPATNEDTGQQSSANQVDQSPTTTVDEAVIVPEVTEQVEKGSVDPAEQEIKLVKNEETETFVKRIGEKARAVGQENDLYASVMIAQAILESDSGNSELSEEPYYNLFGIKGDHEGESVIFQTLEDDGTGNLYTVLAAFKKYSNYKDSFEDYAKLMKEGIDTDSEIYSDTWKENAQTYKEATEALTGVYATDIDYNKKLNAFIEEYDLTEYDKEKPSTSVSGIIVADTHPDSDFEDYEGEIYAGSEAYAEGNCTQYVYNRVVQLGGYVQINMGNGMDWAATGKANGYEVTNTPKAGTAVSFQPNVAGADSTYGHVAFVEHIYKDGSILISEMNAAGLGVVSFRVIDKNTADILAYVTPK